MSFLKISFRERGIEIDSLVEKLPNKYKIHFIHS